jgi:hypothetical protein
VVHEGEEDVTVFVFLHDPDKSKQSEVDHGHGVQLGAARATQHGIPGEVFELTKSEVVNMTAEYNTAKLDGYASFFFLTL